MDRLGVFWIVGANVVAMSVLYQRLLTMGYVLPFQDEVDRLYQKLGWSAGTYQQCGYLDPSTYILTSSRVVFPDGVRPGAVTVRKGKIADMSESPPRTPRVAVFDYKGAVISPGVIDVHVHLNEPGREHWEGITTGTAAAAAGGTTTLVEMPLNADPVTVTAELLQQKIDIAASKARVNLGFWGGIIPANAGQHQVLEGMLGAGALGFKSFVSPSGINDFPNVTQADVEAALPFLMAQGVPYFVHAELVTHVEEQTDADPRQYATYLATRPAHFEQDAIAMLLHAVADVGLQVKPARGFLMHIAHLGDASSIHLVKVAKRKLPVSLETCAHYLNFQSESIPDGDTRFKCAPPLRDGLNRRGLIQGIVDGSIDIVSSDHSPAPPDLKEMESGDFLKAWGGISGLQYLLPATWTALQGAGVDLLHLAQLLSTNPAQLAGLRSKGSLEKGKDADIVVWDPEAAADTSTAANQHRHKVTPYADMALQGKVLATYVGGHLMYKENEGVFEGACGEVVKGRWSRPAAAAAAAAGTGPGASGTNGPQAAVAS